MPSPESTPTPETALDLTEEERTRVYNALAATLEVRSEIIDPAAGTRHLNAKGEIYIPAPYREAAIPQEALESFGLPYDSVVVTDQNPDEVLGSAPIPGLITLATSNMTNQSMPTRDGESTAPGFGTEEKYVIFSKENLLGVVVEREDGEAELQDGSAAEQWTATDPESEQEVNFTGMPTYFTDAPPLTRREILDITAALETLNQS